MGAAGKGGGGRRRGESRGVIARGGRRRALQDRRPCSNSSMASLQARHRTKPGFMQRPEETTKRPGAPGLVQWHISQLGQLFFEQCARHLWQLDLGVVFAPVRLPPLRRFAGIEEVRGAKQTRIHCPALSMHQRRWPAPHLDPRECLHIVLGHLRLHGARRAAATPCCGARVTTLSSWGAARHCVCAAAQTGPAAAQWNSGSPPLPLTHPRPPPWSHSPADRVLPRARGPQRPAAAAARLRVP